MIHLCWGGGACYRPRKERNNDTVCPTSLNCLLDEMQIATDCICLSFLHYEFSNVFSKHSDQSRHKGIICIDLTFFHCVLSNVISNFLHDQRKIHTGCTFNLSPLSVFKCFLELPALKDA